MDRNPQECSSTIHPQSVKHQTSWQTPQPDFNTIKLSKPPQKEVIVKIRKNSKQKLLDEIAKRFNADQGFKEMIQVKVLSEYGS